MLNSILNARYQVVQVMTQGGYSRTYLARDLADPQQGKRVIKHLKPHAEAEPHHLEVARRMFLREAEVLARIGQHPRLPTLLDRFEQDQEFYMVLEYLEGRPLDAELIPGRAWPEDRVLQLLTEGLELLEFVHRHEVIHRDIKPENLVRCADGHLALIDFGAVLLNRLGGTADPRNLTVTVGTPGYMPPEQFQGMATASSDLYALGMVTVRAMTGCSPHELSTDAETGELSWRRLASGNAKLMTVVDRMVRKDSARRPQSAAEVRYLLQQEGAQSTSTVSMPPMVRARTITTVVEIPTAGGTSSYQGGIPAIPPLPLPQSVGSAFGGFGMPASSLPALQGHPRTSPGHSRRNILMGSGLAAMVLALAMGAFAASRPNQPSNTGQGSVASAKSGRDLLEAQAELQSGILAGGMTTSATGVAGIAGSSVPASAVVQVPPVSRSQAGSQPTSTRADHKNTQQNQGNSRSEGTTTQATASRATATASSAQKEAQKEAQRGSRNAGHESSQQPEQNSRDNARSEDKAERSTSTSKAKDQNNSATLDAIGGLIQIAYKSLSDDSNKQASNGGSQTSSQKSGQNSSQKSSQNGTKTTAQTSSQRSAQNHTPSASSSRVPSRTSESRSSGKPAPKKQDVQKDSQNKGASRSDARAAAHARALKHHRQFSQQQSEQHKERP